VKRILIVDDDAELRANLSEILKNAGYHTDEASSGGEAIRKATSEDFDIMLLDLIMPKMNGIDVLTEMQKIKPGIKVIMITAFATVENAVEAIRKGASDYISKPFKIDALLATIRGVLEEVSFEEGIKRLDLDSTLNSLSSPIRRKIIRLLSSRICMRLIEITRGLGVDDHTKVLFHLKMLKESGLIGQDMKRSYFLTDEGKKVLNCLEILDYYLST